MQQEPKEYNLVLVGDCESGKTSLLNRYLELPVSSSYTKTTTVEHRYKLISHQNIGVNIQIIDTPGSSIHQVERREAYKGCDAMIFVTDLYQNFGMDFVASEIEQIITNDLCSYSCLGFLLGVKKDKSKPFSVPQEDYKMLGNLVGEYLEVDLDSFQSISSVISHIVEQIMKFDNEDTKILSMLETLYESSHNPDLERLRQLFESKSQAPPINPVQVQVNAAPVAPVEDQKKRVLKTILIGEEQVGKTSICTNYAENIFSQQVKTTIIEGISYKTQIWDTAGMKKFRTITSCYYKPEMDIVFFVYDVTNMKSFEMIEDHVKEFAKYAGEKNRFMGLIANKSDLPRVVSSEMGMGLAQKWKLNFFELSAKNYECLENMYLQALNHVHNIKKEVNPN